MFQRRIQEHQEIYKHEMLYPMLQGYDSYMLDSDLTIVGSDQLFNELMGRFYQERFDQPPQIVMTTKITPGTDGKEKQSKTLGNYIALADSPRDKFGKVMAIPDSLIVQYLEVYTEHPMDEIREIERTLSQAGVNPSKIKRLLARLIVARYHGTDVAADEEAWFDDTFSKRLIPEDIPQVDVPAEIRTIDLLVKCDSRLSRSDARRLIHQKGISLDEGILGADVENATLTNLDGKTSAHAANVFSPADRPERRYREEHPRIRATAFLPP